MVWFLLFFSLFRFSKFSAFSLWILIYRFFFFGLQDDWQMQTEEQKRQILRMLEQSLARELDLERELSDARNLERGLNLHQEEEFQKFPSSRLPDSLVLKRNLTFHGPDLRLQPSIAPIEELSVDSEREKKTEPLIFASRRDVEKQMADLKTRVFAADVRAYDAELRWSLLKERNWELSEEVGCLNRKVQSLERLLQNSDHQIKALSARNSGIETRVITYLVTTVVLLCVDGQKKRESENRDV